MLERLYPSETAEQIAEQIARPLQATREKTVASGLSKRFRCDDCHRAVKGAKKKLCLRCREWKGKGQFYRNRNSKAGLVGWCKKCPSTTRKKRQPG